MNYVDRAKMPAEARQTLSERLPYQAPLLVELGTAVDLTQLDVGIFVDGLTSPTGS